MKRYCAHWRYQELLKHEREMQRLQAENEKLKHTILRLEAVLKRERDELSEIGLRRIYGGGFEVDMTKLVHLE